MTDAEYNRRAEEARSVWVTLAKMAGYEQTPVCPLSFRAAYAEAETDEARSDAAQKAMEEFIKVLPMKNRARANDIVNRFEDLKVLMTHPHDGHADRETCLDCLRRDEEAWDEHRASMSRQAAERLRQSRSDTYREIFTISPNVPEKEQVETVAELSLRAAWRETCREVGFQTVPPIPLHYRQGFMKGLFR